MAETPRIDAVVVGGGPAGLAAGLWLGRYRVRTVVASEGPPRNAAAERIHGYLGLDHTTPDELVERSRGEVAAEATATLMNARVVGISGVDDAFSVEFDDARQLRARRIVLATGVAERPPEVRGLSERLGRSVFHCPSCDGPAVQGRRVAVIGSVAGAPDVAAKLRRWANEVVTIEADAPLGEPDRVRGVASSIRGEDGAVSAVVLEDGREVRADAVFFATAPEPRTDLARGLGCELDDEGFVAVNQYGLTSVPGVYAAGDLTPGVQLVQVAAAKGATAGIACAESLS